MERLNEDAFIVKDPNGLVFATADCRDDHPAMELWS